MARETANFATKFKKIFDRICLSLVEFYLTVSNRYFLSRYSLSSSLKL